MFKYLRLVFLLGPKIIWNYFAWMIKYSRNPSKYPIEERYGKVRNIIIKVLEKWPVDFHVENIDILTSQTSKYLLVSNHLSFMDPLLLIAKSEKPISFIVKKEAAKYPFVARCIKSIDGIFLDRGDIRQEVKCIKTASERIASGYISYVIYPEGTRNRNPLSPTQEFKPGALKIASKSNAPVICYAGYGSFLLLDKKVKLKHYPIEMKFLSCFAPSVFKEKATPELSIEMHDLIAQEVEKLREQSNNHLIELENKKK